MEQPNYPKTEFGNGWWKLKFIILNWLQERPGWLLLCPEMVLQVFVLEQGPFLHNHVALILINLHAKVLTVTNGYLLNLIIIMKLFELIMHIYTF